MAYLKKASFAAGELDPSLHDKTDIKSYYSGLATARNVVLGKTGRIINSAGTWFNTLTKNNDVGTRIYAPEYPTDGTGAGIYRDYILEFGVGYVRGYYIYFDENYYKYFVMFDEDLTTGYTLSDLPNLRFQTIKEPDDQYLIYVACKDKPLWRIKVASGVITPIYAFNSYPIVKNESGSNKLKMNIQGLTAANINARIGHPVNYGITVVTKDGLESPILQFNKYYGSDAVEPTYMRLPVNNEVTGFYFTFFNVATSEFNYGQNIKYINVYRRPYSGGSPSTGDGSGWGLIGQSYNTNSIDLTTPASVTFGFTDYGQAADYTNPPPELFDKYAAILDPLSVTYLGPTNIYSYNSRLLHMRNSYLFFSKTNFPLFILRDFPLTETTSTYFEIGNMGPQIYHVVEYNGLFVFTSEGAWYGGIDQPVSSLNPLLKKAGSWIIDENVKPMVTPYGLLFIDRATGSIRTIFFSNDKQGIDVKDISVFSNHLFYGKRVVNWAFKGGDLPYLFIILNDGTGVSLTYSKDEEINAWTRHDTDGLYKDVVNYKSFTTGEEYLMFTVLRNGILTIESESKRILVSPTTIRSFVHSAIYTRNIGVSLITPPSLVQPFPPIAPPSIKTLLPVSGTWDVQVRAVTGSDYTTLIGKTFAVYNSEKDDYYYMVIAAATAGVDVTFDIIGEALPTNLRNTPVELIECHTVVTGLSHLNGKDVSIYADNEVVASPNNEQLDLPTYTVSGGQITLPEPKAFSIVGLPYTSDVETLAIDSKDGSMSLDSKIVNNVVVRYSRTRGVYVGKFPEGDSVIDMEVADQWDTEDTVNRPLTEKITSKTYRPYSDWQLQGKVCLRQVDPLPMEVTSIILDVSGG